MRRRWVLIVLGSLAVAGIAGGVLVGVNHYRQSGSDPAAATKASAAVPELTAVTLKDESIRGLGLNVQPVKLRDYPRSLDVPGSVVDLPGHCDYSVSAPVAGVVSQVSALPGDIVKPGQPLFTIRLVGEAMQLAQSELYKASEELRLDQELMARLEQSRGSVPESRSFEARQQLRRHEAAVKSHRNDLLARGLSAEQADSVQTGTFVAQITVKVPEPPAAHLTHTKEGTTDPAFTYEVQDLKVKLGTQATAGEVVVVLANHHKLMIEGRVFDSEAGLVAAAANTGQDIEVDFPGIDPTAWPLEKPRFTIRSLGNTIDPASRTLPFFVPLENQSKSYLRDGKPYLIWRYRPGQRVRLRVPTALMDEVYVVPLGAVVKDGVESFVYRQSGEMFQRRPVRVLYEDRLNAVLANDGGISDGQYVATENAAALERARKAAQAKLSKGGAKPGGHFHADGTYHAGGDDD